MMQSQNVDDNIFHVCFFLLLCFFVFFPPHLAASSRKGELFSFHRLSNDSISKNTKFGVIFHCVGGGSSGLVE